MIRPLARSQDVHGARQDSRRDCLLGLLIVLFVVLALQRSRLWRPGVIFDGRDNVQVAEAQAWCEGRMHLPERQWDTALVGDRSYSHFPPLFSAMAAAVAPFVSGFPHWLMVLTVVAPPLLLAYFLFVRLTGTVLGGIILCFAFVCGTSLWPVIDRALRDGTPWFVNGALGTAGLLVFLNDYAGRRRIWPGALGLVMAALTRQFTIVYLAALAAVAYRRDDDPHRTRNVAIALAAGGLVITTYLALNTAKFGHPLDNGYMRIYDQTRNDPLARDARAFGIFSLHYVPRNLYYANLGLPRPLGQRGGLHPNPHGTGIWWTTPLLLWVLFDIRRIWRDRPSRWLLICAGVVFAALMCYHSTGYAQRGYNRYSLDYVPVLIALVAPRCLTGRRVWISLAMIAWSVVYFLWVT